MPTTRPRSDKRLTTVGPRLGIVDTSTAKIPPKQAEPFYTSKEWRDLVAEIRRERGARCEDCGDTRSRIIGDHVHELRDGGALLEKANIRLLCLPCHNKKTAQVKARRLGGGGSKSLELSGVGNRPGAHPENFSPRLIFPER